MTPSNKWWILCALSLTFVARFGSCIQPELFIFNELCALRDNAGPCKAIMHRFFFNVDTGICELFEYGGCGGNDNNFKTKDECEEMCVVSDDKNPCHLPEAPGRCRGMLTRYFFDSTSQRCKQFFYGGCFGNANNFKSMAACQARCESQAEPTKAPEVHTLSARKSAVVQPIMLNEELSEPQVQANTTNQEPKALEMCFSPVDRGTCNGAERRFAFNPKIKRCQMFHYSGCGGNDNNFTMRKECIAKCIRSRKAHGKRTIRIKKKNMGILVNHSV